MVSSPLVSMTGSSSAVGSIDLVVVNLYPFEETIAKEGVTLEEAIENVDIGGPAMLRASAKNHNAVVCVTSAAQYGDLIAEMQANNGSTTIETRRRLAGEAFALSAHYDAEISKHFAKENG